MADGEIHVGEEVMDSLRRIARDPAMWLEGYAALGRWISGAPKVPYFGATAPVNGIEFAEAKALTLTYGGRTKDFVNAAVALQKAIEELSTIAGQMWHAYHRASEDATAAATDLEAALASLKGLATGLDIPADVDPPAPVPAPTRPPSVAFGTHIGSDAHWF